LAQTIDAVETDRDPKWSETARPVEVIDSFSQGTRLPSGMATRNGRWRVLRPLRRPRTAAQQAVGGQPSTANRPVLADHDLGVAAACWAESALAAWDESVAGILIEVDGREDEPCAQLPCGRPHEIQGEGGRKYNGDDEHRSPSPT